MSAVKRYTRDYGGIAPNNPPETRTLHCWMELLVHVSAPSSKKDDERYKRQSSGYNAFESRHSTRLSSYGDPLRRLGALGMNTSRDEGIAIAEDVLIPPAEQSYVDDTQLAISALESQILSDSARQTLYQFRHSDEASLIGHQGSLSSPAQQTESEVARESRTTDSIRPTEEAFRPHDHDRSTRTTPDIGVVAEGGARARNDTSSASLRTPSKAGSNDIPVLRSPYVPLQEGHAIGVGYVGTSTTDSGSQSSKHKQTISPVMTRKGQSSSWSGDDIPSQLPSTYSLTDETSNNTTGYERNPQSLSRNRNHASQFDNGDIHTPVEHAQSQLDGSVALHSSAPRAASSTANSTGHTSDRMPDELVNVPQRNNVEVVNDRPMLACQNVSDRALLKGMESTTNTVPTSTEQKPPSTETMARLTNLSTTIRPPAPPTSIDSFSTHVTPSLRSLITNSDLKNRYKPALVTRDIRVSERGFWLLNTDAWSLDLQLEVWVFLTKMIESGNAGWGVWCAREVVSNGAGSLNSPGNVSLGSLQVFCWGEVVEHVYLMLYVASRSRIKRAAAVWIDAGEEIIVRME